MSRVWRGAGCGREFGLTIKGGRSSKIKRSLEQGNKVSRDQEIRRSKEGAGFEGEFGLNIKGGQAAESGKPRRPLIHGVEVLSNHPYWIVWGCFEMSRGGRGWGVGLV